MTTESTVRVQVRRRFEASPERVFDAWLDPSTAGRWLFVTAGGEMVRAEVDARVGGSFTFTDRRDGRDIEHVGEYLEIGRPRRLVFTFGVPAFSDLRTRVIVEIAPVDGGCELTLTHEGVLAEYEGRTQQGWRMLLDGLATTLGLDVGASG